MDALGEYHYLPSFLGSPHDTTRAQVGTPIRAPKHQAKDDHEQRKARTSPTTALVGRSCRSECGGWLGGRGWLDGWGT